MTSYPVGASTSVGGINVGMPRQLLSVGVVAILTLAGCGEPESPPPSEPELGPQIWQHVETGAAVRPYDGCLKQTARTTQPTSDLGLERIDAILAACSAEEKALIEAVQRVWKTETEEELAERNRAVRTEALKIIKDTPYVPPSVVVPN